MLAWIRRVVIGLAVIAAGGLAVYVFILPRLVENTIRDELNAIGLTESVFELRSVSPWRLTLAAVRSDATAEPALQIDSVEMTFSPATLWRGQAIDIVLSGATWRSAYADGRLRLSPFDSLQLPEGGGAGKLSLPFERLALRNATVQVEADGRLWRMPVQATVHAQADGTIQADATLDAFGDTWRMEASLTPATTEQPAQLHATMRTDRAHDHHRGVRLQSGPLTARLTATLNQALAVVTASGQFEAGQLALAGDWSDMSWSYRGAVQGSLQWTHGGLEPHLHVRIDDAAFELPELDTVASGLTGAVTVDSFTPTTPANQTVHVGDLRLGPVHLGQGRIVFSVPAPQRLRMHEMTWSSERMGRFHTEPFDWPMDDPQRRVRMAIGIESLPLKPWLELLTPTYARGEGELFGRIALRVRASPPYRLVLEHLQLTAREGGTLRMVDTDPLEQAMLAADPRFSMDHELRVVKDQLLTALRDFSFTRLSIRSVDERPADGQTGSQPATDLVTLSLAGTGRRGDRPLPVENLTINLRGVHGLMDLLSDELAGRFVALGQKMEQAIQQGLER